jgi:hypothetical protein
MSANKSLTLETDIEDTKSSMQDPRRLAKTMTAVAVAMTLRC